MELRYDPQRIEGKWQDYWERNKSFRAVEDPSKEKYYLLEMFPYPSGKIHMGHVRNYSIGDVVARYKRMKGYNVLHPMGWDAFGLPAENAAIEMKVHPAKWTFENIDNMRAQLKRMGFSYDWEREIASCHPGYYKWSQWFFLKMFERGIAYRKKGFVNWCGSCETVLANEQVEAGQCWRCQTEVIQKELEGWYLKITLYAEELLAGCESLAEGWPERVLTMQKNWIGKSYGALVDFPVWGSDKVIQVYTTRQDTLFGATFMVLAPEHPLSRELSHGTPYEEEVSQFIKEQSRIDRYVREAETTEKKGVFTGAYCMNPMNGEKIPVWVANFVLMEYGTGAVMAVPAHDQRDLDFARKYRIPVKVVIRPPDRDLDEETMTEAYVDEGILVNSGQFNGLWSKEALDRIGEYLEEKGIGKRTVNYRLRDWGISRQRYWGTPIPIIYCDRCGIVPVPYEDLPVILPLDIEMGEGGRSPLPECEEFVNTTCPSCKGQGRRETDTMDTFICSSWYFDRYTCPRYEEGPLDQEKLRYWMPVDQYIGGIEHAILHLLYSRFFTMFLRDIGLIHVGEPYRRLLTQGMVCKASYRCPNDGFLYPEEVKSLPDGLICKKCSGPVEVGRTEKMSKSKKNVVDPDHIVKQYGADTVRLFCLSDSPPEKDLEWSDQGVEGAFRFLNRIWNMVINNHQEIQGIEAFGKGVGELNGEERAIYRKVHWTIKKVTDDIDRRYHFNTALSAIRELVNEIYAFSSSKGPHRGPLMKLAIETALILLNPFIPHITEELWELMGHETHLLDTKWPSYDQEALEEEEMVIVVQVNGKVRSRITVPSYFTEEEILLSIKKDNRIAQWLKGKEIERTVYVPGKLMNIVI